MMEAAAPTLSIRTLLAQAQPSTFDPLTITLRGNLTQPSGDVRVRVRRLRELHMKVPEIRSRWKALIERHSVIRQPRVVGSLGAGDDPEACCWVLEDPDAATLAQVLAVSGGFLNSPLALHVVREVLGGLREGHLRGLVHRDLSPQNVYITRDGAVKLGEFGVWGVVDAQQRARLRFDADLLAYDAPEDVLQTEGGVRSDLFSAGVMLHELVTGVHPFRLDNRIDTSLALAEGRRRPVADEKRRAAAHELAGVLEILLATDPEQRFQSVDAAGNAMNAFGASPSNVSSLAELARRALARAPHTRSRFEGTHLFLPTANELFRTGQVTQELTEQTYREIGRPPQPDHRKAPTPTSQISMRNVPNAPAVRSAPIGPIAAAAPGAAPQPAAPAAPAARAPVAPMTSPPMLSVPDPARGAGMPGSPGAPPPVAPVAPSLVSGPPLLAPSAPVLASAPPVLAASPSAASSAPPPITPIAPRVLGPAAPSAPPAITPIAPRVLGAAAPSAAPALSPIGPPAIAGGTPAAIGPSASPVVSPNAPPMLAPAASAPGAASAPPAVAPAAAIWPANAPPAVVPSAVVPTSTPSVVAPTRAVGAPSAATPPNEPAASGAMSAFLEPLPVSDGHTMHEMKTPFSLRGPQQSGLSARPNLPDGPPILVEPPLLQFGSGPSAPLPPRPADPGPRASGIRPALTRDQTDASQAVVGRDAVGAAGRGPSFGTPSFESAPTFDSGPSFVSGPSFASGPSFNPADRGPAFPAFGELPPGGNSEAFLIPERSQLALSQDDAEPHGRHRAPTFHDETGFPKTRGSARGEASRWDETRMTIFRPAVNIRRTNQTPNARRVSLGGLLGLAFAVSALVVAGGLLLRLFR